MDVGDKNKRNKIRRAKRLASPQARYDENQRTARRRLRKESYEQGNNSQEIQGTL